MVRKWEKDMSNVSQTTTSDISNYVRPSENTSLDKILKTSSNLISTESVKLEKDESPSSPESYSKYPEVKRIQIFLNEWNNLIPSLKELSSYSHKYYKDRLRILLHRIATEKHPYPLERL